MTMTTRREAMALISGALASTTLSGRAFAEGAPKKGGTLRISAPANPSSLDPATGGAGSDHAFLFTMYDTLTEWEFDTLKPKPGLAESWKFTDPTTLGCSTSAPASPSMTARRSMRKPSSSISSATAAMRSRTSRPTCSPSPRSRSLARSR
ncbi:ABC-type oligopeptide transport system substrate-binding subunit [Bradyrhizobium sp. USDA 4522]